VGVSYAADSEKARDLILKTSGGLVHGIELPFPQRDLHIKSIPEVKARTGPEEG
jgi:small-conductance mechanosensitive channel